MEIAIYITLAVTAWMAVAVLTRQSELARERKRLCPPGYRWVGDSKVGAKGYVNDAGHFIPWEVAADLHSRGYY